MYLLIPAGTSIIMSNSNEPYTDNEVDRSDVVAMPPKRLASVPLLIGSFFGGLLFTILIATLIFLTRRRARIRVKQRDKHRGMLVSDVRLFKAARTQQRHHSSTPTQDQDRVHSVDATHESLAAYRSRARSLSDIVEDAPRKNGEGFYALTNVHASASLAGIETATPSTTHTAQSQNNALRTRQWPQPPSRSQSRGPPLLRWESNSSATVLSHQSAGSQQGQNDSPVLASTPRTNDCPSPDPIRTPTPVLITPALRPRPRTWDPHLAEFSVEQTTFARRRPKTEPTCYTTRAEVVHDQFDAPIRAASLTYGAHIHHPVGRVRSENQPPTVAARVRLLSLRAKAPRSSPFLSLSSGERLSKSQSRTKDGKRTLQLGRSNSLEPSNMIMFQSVSQSSTYRRDANLCSEPDKLGHVRHPSMPRPVSESFVPFCDPRLGHRFQKELSAAAQRISSQSFNSLTGQSVSRSRCFRWIVIDSSR